MKNPLNKLAKSTALVIIALQCNSAICQTVTNQSNSEDDYTLDSKQKSTYYKTPAEEKEDNNVYTEVDKKPEFPDGYSALYKFIADNLKYPVTAKIKGIQGKVYVRFVVGKDGNVEEPEVVSSDNSALNAEAVRVVKSLPKWIPGSHNGKNVRVSNTIPVNFKLDEQMIANNAPQTSQNDGEQVFLLPEKMPVFPGGDVALREYIAKNTIYPEEAKVKKIQGTVYVQFVIGKDGEIKPESVKAIRNIDQIYRGVDFSLLDPEAIRIVKCMPKWEPGKVSRKINNERVWIPVNVSWTVPVHFELPTGQTSSDK